jgi:HK97 family phage major capsid protein
MGRGALHSRLIRKAALAVARNTLEAWIPEEYDSEVITKIKQLSALEAHAHRVTMTSQTKSTPRSGGMDVEIVSKGGTYGEDSNANDDVTLHAQKFGKALRVAEEDIDDSLADFIDTKMGDWGTAYAKSLDNAGFGVTAAKGTSGCAFDSLYYLLTQNDATIEYTANANLTKTGSGGPSYDGLSNVFGKVEESDYYDEDELLVIAHPRFRKRFRGIKDGDNRPIFQESSNGTPGGGTGRSPDTVFGHQIHWSLGARTSATVTSKPTGNPLMIVCNRKLLLLGIRSGPESIFIDGRDGLAALTDESILKMRSRRAFAPGHLKAFSVYEDESAA